MNKKVFALYAKALWHPMRRPLTTLIALAECVVYSIAVVILLRVGFFIGQNALVPALQWIFSGV